MVLMLFVCEPAMFPPLKSPLTSFDADEIAKLVSFACWSVMASPIWLFAVPPNAARMAAAVVVVVVP